MRWRTLSLSLGGVFLLAGTVLVFRAFDLHSHSASDTLRPFLITVVPVWVVAIAAAQIVLRDRR
ncbi:MAG: hypothetical protein OEW31_11035 [Thermoleophilia bacterium]|nr:hypothetical protein [Thermoleophilia bacterium]MDH4346857.1 hypothetical protein [Thermoleophilia bacterium]MDH5333224.1 hypothetical protein [Thermoleophilia bacterium]